MPQRRHRMRTYTAVDECAGFLKSAAGRVYDSRATGFTKFGSDETRTIEVAGNLGIPSADSGTIAVTLTLTSTGGEGGSTRATAWTEGNAAPGTTSLSLGAGTLRSNTIGREERNGDRCGLGRECERLG